MTKMTPEEYVVDRVQKLEMQINRLEVELEVADQKFKELEQKYRTIQKVLVLRESMSNGKYLCTKGSGYIWDDSSDFLPVCEALGIDPNATTEEEE